jgi:hypothetical protein
VTHRNSFSVHVPHIRFCWIVMISITRMHSGVLRAPNACAGVLIAA